ncbi:hypothetical protein K431DRAFT_286085 [Polychaeton citri CBS 116435]|uniref:RRM domain-containing protein n=1 Tax=Polychaeton citri CBS 116435 TaxID=1314669 RepID=A0A9P4Q5C2_9PEZI|nr:hypothetical protein K431DRAFT_286085 [Polychaeton citri CBS 116435]
MGDRQKEKGGRVVFIGNIPYGVSEEQICEIFSSCGKVVNFRLVYDKETGRPKGFGFLEYTNVDDAATAVRNLNEHEVMGRTLRVDYSNDNGGGKGSQQSQPPAQQQPTPAQFGMDMTGASQLNGQADASALPGLPPGVELPPGTTAPDAISRTLSTVPPAQLLDFISQMKGLVHSNPAQAMALLGQAPQLSYAIFQAMLLMDLVDTSVVGQLIQQQPPPPPQPAIPQAPPPMSFSAAPVPITQPGFPTQFGTPMQQQPPAQFQPPPQQYQPPQPAFQPQPYAPTPPVQHPAYQPPPQQQAAPQLDPAQRAMIQQIMSMTPEQVAAIPDEGQRNTVLQLRQQWGPQMVA